VQVILLWTLYTLQNMRVRDQAQTHKRESIGLRKSQTLQSLLNLASTIFSMHKSGCCQIQVDSIRRSWTLMPSLSTMCDWNARSFFFWNRHLQLLTTVTCTMVELDKNMPYEDNEDWPRETGKRTNTLSWPVDAYYYSWLWDVPHTGLPVLLYNAHSLEQP